MKEAKLVDSAELFSRAVKYYGKAKGDPLAFAALSKTYEVAFEYAWKFFKKIADESGFEVYSPRDAIKAVAQEGIISDISLWNQFLNARNLSVHDYLGTAAIDFESVATLFEKELAILIEKQRLNA